MLCLNNQIIAYGAKDLIQILQKNIRKICFGGGFETFFIYFKLSGNDLES